MSEEFKDIPVLDVDYHLREYDSVLTRLSNVGGFDELAELCSDARSEILRLINGPGGIMEMKQTIADKEAEIERLRKKCDKQAMFIRRIFPETFPETPFISGVMDEKDQNNMPKMITVCPAFGVDFSYVYEYTGRTIGGMGS